MSNQTKDKLIDSLYRRCQIRNATSKEVFDQVVSDLGLFGTQHLVDKAVDIIRPYKNTGINLESTADALYNLLYPSNKDQKNDTGDFWDQHDT